MNSTNNDGPTAADERAAMSEIDNLIAKAEREYERSGIIKTTTFCSLTDHGIDAQSVLDSLEASA